MKEKAIEWKDISSELFRTYDFKGYLVTIEEPDKLNVSRSGGHRVVDKAGNSHYIAPGWVKLGWRAREGQPAFVF